VLVSFVYVVACRLFALVLLLARSDRSKELEILLLRHELSILRGRLVLGLGAGWYDAEYEAFGYSTDGVAARARPADPDPRRCQGTADAPVGRAPRRRLEHRLVRGAGRPSPPATVAPASNAADDVAFAGSIEELAGAIDAHEALGVDDLIVELEPETERSLDRLAKVLRLRNR
jgi:hypothetical protein